MPTYNYTVYVQNLSRALASPIKHTYILLYYDFNNTLLSLSVHTAASTYECPQEWLADKYINQHLNQLETKHLLNAPQC